MIFKETKIKDAYLIKPNLIQDKRGFFSRVFCNHEFEKRALKHHLLQCNISWNHSAGTIRGLHLQKPPQCEAKIIRCTSGAIFDVIIDLRPESETYLQWIGEVLSSENRNMLYVPERCAHGYQSLEDRTEVFYQTTEEYAPSLEEGIRWDDPFFKINWPLLPSFISEKDQTFLDFQGDVFSKDTND